MVDANPVKVETGRRHGLAVAGPGRRARPALAAEFVPFADWSPDPESIILLCTKCYDNPAVLERLRESAVLVPVQNGFDPLLDARPHGLEGVASFVSECQAGEPVTRITRSGDLHLGGRGVRNPRDTVPLRDLAGALAAARLFRVHTVEDVRPFKHTKLLYNAAIAPLAAAAGIDNGDLLGLPEARSLFFALLRENGEILRAAGKPLGRVGPFHPDTVAAILNRPWLADGLAWLMRPSLRGTYCSMAPDLPRGRTEIDFYNGRLVEWAAGRPCPLNRAAVALVRRMERERIPPHRGVLAELRPALGA
jgi:2-dehydropantoate 2-reductase